MTRKFRRDAAETNSDETASDDRPHHEFRAQCQLQIVGRDCTWLPRAFTSRRGFTVNPKYQPPLFNWHCCVMAITARGLNDP